MKKKTVKFLQIVLTLVIAGVFCLIPVTASATGPDWSAVLMPGRANGVSEAVTLGSAYGWYGGIVSTSNAAYLRPNASTIDGTNATFTITTVNTGAIPTIYAVFSGPVTVSGSGVTVLTASEFANENLDGFAMWYSSDGTRPSATSYALPDTRPSNVTVVKIVQSTAAATTYTITAAYNPPDAISDGILPGSLSFIDNLFITGTKTAQFVTGTPIVLIGFVLSLVYFFMVGMRKFFN